MTDDEKAEAVRLIQAYEATDLPWVMGRYDAKHPAQKAFYEFAWRHSGRRFLHAGRLYFMDPDGCLCCTVLDDPDQVVNLDEDV